MEALPWDEWGGMRSSYEGTSGPSFDALIDDVAAACASADPDVVRALYESDGLRVPDPLLGS